MWDSVPQALLFSGPLLLIAPFVVVRLVRRWKSPRHAEGPVVRRPREESNLAFLALQGALGEVSAARKTLQGERDRAEAQRREMERYHSLILGSISSGVIGLSERGIVRTVNPAAGKILGVHPLTLRGRPLIDCLGECEGLEEGLSEVLEQGRAFNRREVVVVRPGGGKRWLGVSLSPLVGAGGRISGAVFLFSDLTEVRRLHEKVELKRRLESMGEMLAAIAHEGRNGMGAVSGYARLLEREGLGEAQRREAVAGILREVEAVERVLVECLDYVRPRPLRPQRVDLAGLAGEVVLGAEPLASERQVEIVLDLPEYSMEAQVDREQLRQALANLLRNGVQASEAGGRVDLRVAPVAGMVEIAVIDRGCGIAEEELVHICDPFYTTRAEGTGLGMSIAQRIILAHEGRLEIDSRVGKGTVARVTLPGRRVAPDPVEASDTVAEPA